MNKQTTIFDDVMVDVNVNTDKLLLNKLRKPLKPSVSRGVVEIYDEVTRVFADVKALVPYINFELITTESRLWEYLAKIKENGIVALDTETDGLDVLADRIAGVSLYTKGESAIYIPINHDYYDHNVDKEIVSKFIQAIVDSGVKVVFHNARFDIRVVINNLGVRLKAYYDTFIGSRLVNENLVDASLKGLWAKYCAGGNSHKYGELFSGLRFTVFDPEKVFIYAALDAVMTMQLYEMQIPYLTPDNPLCIEQDLVDTADLMMNVEMPIIDVAVDMEEYGICLDVQRANELRDKYQHEIERIERRVHEILKGLMPTIRANITPSQLLKLSDPINLNSPEQWKIICYDGLGLVVPKGKTKAKKDQSTNAETLTYFANAYPEYKELFTLALETKTLSKMVSTYLVALPKRISPKTGRLHTSWNTLGADTGRFSSSEPNLQNIPARNKDIRPIFVPSEGCIFISADFSSQEPRILTEVSQDPILLDNFIHNRDIYSTLISIAIKEPYEKCTKDTPEGKKRRNQGKKLQLALSYGMQYRSLAVELKIMEEEAKALYATFKENLSGVFEYEDRLKAFCRRNGYVKTLWGRKRRFPEYMLQDYEIVGDMPQAKKNVLISRIRKAWFKNRPDVIQEIQDKYGVVVVDNYRKIHDAETQIMNAVIQGSASDMTKVALLFVHYDEVLRSYGSHVVLVIHDEIIIECPKEHQEVCAKRLEELMVKAAQTKVKSIPFASESEVMDRWYKD